MSLSAVLAALSAIPQLLELIDTTVQNVEKTFTGLSGEAKAAAAAAKVESLAAKSLPDADQLQSVSSVVGPLIDSAVAGFNAAKVFVSGKASSGADTSAVTGAAPVPAAA